MLMNGPDSMGMSYLEPVQPFYIDSEHLDKIKVFFIPPNLEKENISIVPLKNIDWILILNLFIVRIIISGVIYTHEYIHTPAKHLSVLPCIYLSYLAPYLWDYLLIAAFEGGAPRFRHLSDGGT